MWVDRAGVGLWVCCCDCCCVSFIVMVNYFIDLVDYFNVLYIEIEFLMLDVFKSRMLK